MVEAEGAAGLSCLKNDRGAALLSEATADVSYPAFSSQGSMTTSSDLRFLDPDDISARQAWDDAVKNSPDGTVFHTTAWMDVIRKGLGLTPRFAYLPGARGSVRALVPLFSGGWARPVRWLNFPQGCAAHPLASDDEEAALLLEQLVPAAAAEGATALLLRTPRVVQPAMPEGWQVRREQPVLRHVLDLSGAKDVETLPRMQRKLRQKVRSAARRLTDQGIGVRLAGPHDARAFARELHRILLCKHGHLGPPVRFFEALQEFLPTSARLVSVGPETGRALAFQVSISDPACCNLLYGCGLPGREGSEAYRTVIATEIDTAINAGVRSLDFSETGTNQDGLIYFKETWGSERADGSYMVMAKGDAESGLRDIGGAHFAMIQRLFRLVPVALSLRIAGSVHKALQ